MHLRSASTVSMDREVCVFAFVVVVCVAQRTRGAGPHPRSGLELYSDLTQGLGPEVIVTKVQTPVQVGVKLFSAGAFSVARGELVVIKTGVTPRIRPVIKSFLLGANGEETLIGTF